MEQMYKPPMKTRTLREFTQLTFLIGLIGAASSVLAQKPAAAPTAVPPYYQTEAAAKPLPATLSPALFEDPTVARAYRVAQQIPGVLAQQPCYCWCNRIGHRSLLDCYASPHAESCLICTKEALLAGQLHAKGLSAEKIRAAIIRGDGRTAE